MAEAPKRGIIGYLMLSVRGMMMGAADVVPGVSGGTMAFILGIYEELLEAIKKFSSLEAIGIYTHFQIAQAFRKLPWQFVLFLAAGIVAAFLTLAGPITWMLKNQPSLIWAFFFGLVLASVVAVWRRVKKWNIFTYAFLIAGGVFAFWLVGVVPTQTPENWWFIIICGALAICAMILPGISGSFILLLLGKYHFMLETIQNTKAAARSLDFAALWSNGIVLLCFLVGIVIGLSSFVRLLSWMFRKAHDLTVAALIGFMLGSLRRVWPWKSGDINILPSEWNRTTLFAISCAILGFALVLFIEYIANRKEKSQA
ncbi:MAG: DUF368 domain-containing protein [Victivallales bacterium]|nr:DUF368 domain-containing protein [Victivallales bacterium]